VDYPNLITDDYHPNKEAIIAWNEQHIESFFSYKNVPRKKNGELETKIGLHFPNDGYLVSKIDWGSIEGSSDGTDD